MEQLQLCTFEQCKTLKEIGFNWKTEYTYFYDLDNPTEQDNPDNWAKDISPNLCDWNNFNNGLEIYMSCPTVALVRQWLRDVKGVHCGADWDSVVFNEYQTYELAKSEALTEALKLLNKTKK